MRLNIRNLIIWLLIIAVVVTFHIVRRNSTMRGVETVVVGNDPCLLTVNDVDSLILASFPDLLKTDIKRVEKKKIRKMLEAHPYIAEAQVGMSTGGKLLVEVTQHLPIVRVFYNDKEFYISEQGTYMPLCTNHFCDVIVASSELEEPQQIQDNNDSAKTKENRNKSQLSTLNTQLTNIWRLAKFLHDNPRYDGVFDQIYLSDKNDLILTPKLGSTSVIVGDTTLLDEKFENLWTFYDKGVKKMGWDTYSSINLKFRNQLVCTKK